MISVVVLLAASLVLLVGLLTTLETGISAVFADKANGNDVPQNTVEINQGKTGTQADRTFLERICQGGHETFYTLGFGGCDNHIGVVGNSNDHKQDGK